MAEAGLARALLRRMAHDLASPLAALVTARGLGLPPEEARPFEEEAIARLSDRLDLWRLLAAPPDSALDVARLESLLMAETDGRVRPTITLSPASSPALARAAAALLLGVRHLPGVEPRGLRAQAAALVLELADSPAARSFAAGLAAPNGADPAGALAWLGLAIAGPPAIEASAGAVRLTFVAPARG